MAAANRPAQTVRFTPQGKHRNSASPKTPKVSAADRTDISNFAVGFTGHAPYGGEISYRGRDSSKAAVARMEILEGGVKIGSAKVRPQARSEIQFRVSNLPKRTVAEGRGGAPRARGGR